MGDKTKEPKISFNYDNGFLVEIRYYDPEKGEEHIFEKLPNEQYSHCLYKNILSEEKEYVEGHLKMEQIKNYLENAIKNKEGIIFFQNPTNENIIEEREYVIKTGTLKLDCPELNKALNDSLELEKIIDMYRKNTIYSPSLDSNSLATPKIKSVHIR